MQFRREARLLAEDPIEWIISVRERLAERDEQRAKRTGGNGFMPWPPCPYRADQNWDQQLHELLDVAWPCPAQEQFWALWPEAIALVKDRGLNFGRGSFGTEGWGDADPGFARAIYCLTRHLRPDRVVETGVARGITSRFVLEALTSNGSGHLWSIDLPPLREPHLRNEIGIAVPDHFHDRWTYLRGSSRRRLSRLLTRLGAIDLFVHDSKHTHRNLVFELNQAWHVLRPNGALVADDVDLNCGFHTFTATHQEMPTLICPAEPLQPDIGRQDDKGVFSITRRASSSAGEHDGSSVELATLNQRIDAV